MDDDYDGSDRDPDRDEQGNVKPRLAWRPRVRQRTSEYRPRRWTPSLSDPSK